MPIIPNPMVSPCFVPKDLLGEDELLGPPTVGFSLVFSHTENLLYLGPLNFCHMAG